MINKSMPGKLEWIGVREVQGNIKSLDSVLAIKGEGLEGDKITSKKSKKRQVTLMQKEHISVILSLAQEKDQSRIRKIQYYFKRNLLISKCNVQNLKGKIFTIGDAKFLGTGDCKPCKKIENLLGVSMLDAMQGMGGITALVSESGIIKINDQLKLEID
jgi:MOSC domain-containing protein YiiM